MDIDRPPAGCTGPAFPFVPDKRTDNVLSDCREVVEHAHRVFRTIALVQLFQPPARELPAIGVAPALHLPAGRDSAVSAALTVRRITSPAPVLLPEMGHADGTVHATGRDESGRERVFPRHESV
jgi:hypothetical protein